MLLGLFVVLLNSACSVFHRSHHSKETDSTDLTVENESVKTLAADTIEIKESDSKYRETTAIVNRLLHTRLEVNFNWQKKQLNGIATLTLTPYFYPTDTLVLDAKSFDISRCEIVTPKGKAFLPYRYDSSQMIIKLDHSYNAGEQYTIQITYVANPERRPIGGSAAITSDKGLYFINADGSDPNKPKQVWTQGETESNSCWFPTIDKPNIKTTQEMFITVDSTLRTLSNGILVFSKNNFNGTRTDYWRMDYPHSPYLFMMAVSDFAIVEDRWRNIPVDFYVDRDYELVAEDIFGNTPEMMEFFSKRLGVNYPWPKYSQVVVHDYVSGAMENTSATLHGEFLQRNERELLDENGEGIIAHELFHQWFGDLVTCESWSNLTLNESFATYGEYLWDEYKYGKNEAAQDLIGYQNTYLQESRLKKENLVRFDYKDKEEMFDRHTYQKGGCILHMLRQAIGDSAFFKSLNLYLTTYKYKAAEAQQLRLAFEEVTGRDMNWFFNEWYYSSGHPVLDIKYSYDAQLKVTKVDVRQKQTEPSPSVFTMPVNIDIYIDGEKTRHHVWMNKRHQIFTFPTPLQPDLVQFDGDNMLLCEKTENKTLKDYANQYLNGTDYKSQLDAINYFSQKQTSDRDARNLLVTALYNGDWDLKRIAINSIDLSDTTKVVDAPKLIRVAAHDKKPQVRAAAMKALGKIHNTDDKYLLALGIQDSSYNVATEALKAMVKVDKNHAMQAAQEMEQDDNDLVVNTLSKIYGDEGTHEQYNYFVKVLQKRKGWSRYGLVGTFTSFLKRLPEQDIERGLLELLKIAKDDPQWMVRLQAYNSIKSIQDKYRQSDQDKDRATVIQTMLDEVKSLEKNPRLMEVYKSE